MSTVLLIDGYNVIGPVAPPRGFTALNQSGSRRNAQAGRVHSWLQVERQRLLEQLGEHLSDLTRERTCVVFDAKNAPQGLASEARHRSIEVLYAVGYPEADDLLEELIQNHPAPKHLTVVSADHRVQAAARRRKAAYFDSDPWYDDLLDGKMHLGWYPREKKRRKKALADETPGLVDPSFPGIEQAGLEITDEELRGWIDRLDT